MLFIRSLDKSAIGKACEINRLDQLDIKWIDVLPLAREQINKNDVDNYSLSSISNIFDLISSIMMQLKMQKLVLQ